MSGDPQVRVFGNYRALGSLGEGGFGAVFLVEHTLFGKKAAAKVLHPFHASNSELLERFFNEARAATAIRHPNIVEVFDAGRAQDGSPYLLMEYLEGEVLKTRIERTGRLSVATAIAFAVETASALAAAHAGGIVHRDLKPENIFVVPDPRAHGREMVKILDFGIAKLGVGLKSSLIKTQVGQYMGSPPYMSPEQWLAEGDLDHRTDIYALGVVTYEMLLGQPPFVARDMFEARDMHLRTEPPALRPQRDDIPVHVEAAVLRALSKDPKARFETMDAFARALEAPLPGADTSRGVAATLARSVAPPPPQPTVTTLGSAVHEVVQSDVDTDIGPVRTRRWPLIAVAIAAAIVAAGGFALTRKGNAVSTTAVATGEAPVAPDTVALNLGSQPAGAAVKRTDTGEVMGTTPIIGTFPRGQTEIEVVVSKAGFEDQRVRFAPIGDVARTIVLEPRPTPSAAVNPTTALTEKSGTSASTVLDKPTKKSPARTKQANQKVDQKDDEDQWRLH
jgi:serine/threonine-protein kinase